MQWYYARKKSIYVVWKASKETPIGIIFEYSFTCIFPFKSSKSMLTGGIINLFLLSPFQHALNISRTTGLLQFHLNSNVKVAKEGFYNCITSKKKKKGKE